jgi:tRNA modification GTPase
MKIIRTLFNLEYILSSFILIMMFIRPITSFNRQLFQHTKLSVVKRFAFTQDTIYALSSGGLVKSGVAVVRVSGPQAQFCVESLLSPKHNSKILVPRVASLRSLTCPKSGEMLDKALILWFPKPNSFTGEDVVEFHLHGSLAVISGIYSAFEHLNLKLIEGRIRPAEPGEFTKRAFEHGKMDLTEVEGLSDLLAAQTSEQRKQALRQMEGNLKSAYEKWR